AGRTTAKRAATSRRAERAAPVEQGGHVARSAAQTEPPPPPPMVMTVSAGHAVAGQDSPPTTDSMQLGPVRFEAAPGWWFYPMRHSIAGRPKSGVGVFQVKPIPAVALPKPATHEVCMAAAMNA